MTRKRRLSSLSSDFSEIWLRRYSFSKASEKQLELIAEPIDNEMPQESEFTLTNLTANF